VHVYSAFFLQIGYTRKAKAAVKGQSRSNCTSTLTTPEGFVAFFLAASVQECSGYWQEVHKVLLGGVDFASCFPCVGNMLVPKSYTSSENISNAK